MKDKQLFEHISTIVNERKQLSVKQHPGTFAQKFCRQQMIKKKLTPYDPNSKMNHLMSKFSNLETYVNLQQIVKFLKQKEDNKKSSDASATMTSLNKKVTDTKQNITEKQSLQDFIRKKIGRQIASKYESQNQRFSGIIRTLEQNSTVFSQSLKNNSAHGENQILRQIQRNSFRDGNQRIIEVSQYRQNFQKRKKCGKSSQGDSMYAGFKNSGSRLKESRNRAELLHKISTYLQIILQSQHRNKWQQKRTKTIGKNILQPISHQRSQAKSQNLSTSEIYTCPLSIQTAESNQASVISKFPLPLCQKFKQNKLSSVQIKSQSNSLFVTQQRNSDNIQQDKKEIKHKNFHINFSKDRRGLEKKLKNQTLSFFNRKNEAFQKRQKILNEFTFKNRHCKQGIMSKIYDFINLVDQQEHMCKEQNKQLNKAIKKFESIISRDYQQFKQEPLSANDEDVQQVKRIASQTKCNRLSKI